MDFFVNDVSESIERELSRIIGYRLLGWSLVSLWAVAVIILFRLFHQYPAAVDQWLIWVSPLLIIRSIGGALLDRQFRVGINLPSLTLMNRMSLLFGVSDGVLLLSGVILLYSTGTTLELSLIFLITGLLALSAFVYMYTPCVTPITMALVIVPAMILAVYQRLELPLELLLSCVGVLVITCLGVVRFKSLYLRHMQDKLRYQHEIYQAAESNFIFNEHWEKMHVAAIDWDRDCIIRSWNPAAERLFGISAAQAQGQSLELLFDRETAADIRSQWITTTEDKFEPPVLRTHEVLPERPLTCWYDTPLFHDGELIGMASFVIDVAEQPVIKSRQSRKNLLDLFNVGGASAFAGAPGNPVASSQ